MGQIAAREKDFEVAEARFRKALGNDPGDNFLQFRLAQLLADTGRGDSALAVIDQALPLVNKKDELISLREKIVALNERS